MVINMKCDVMEKLDHTCKDCIVAFPPPPLGFGGGGGVARRKPLDVV